MSITTAGNSIVRNILLRPSSHSPHFGRLNVYRIVHKGVESMAGCTGFHQNFAETSVLAVPR